MLGDAMHHRSSDPPRTPRSSHHGRLALGLALAGCGTTPGPTTELTVHRTGDSVRMAVIGDYGLASPEEEAVARLVTAWSPDLVLTLGDNNYPDGRASTIDENIGQYYHAFIHPYRGRYGEGATDNRFFPTLGNHDWNTPGPWPYLDYFSLPGNERYYELTWGPVHLFALDSDRREPDGNHAQSEQARWLKARMSASTSPWQVVYMHHPPHSSGDHGSTQSMRWPFAQWGADLVLSGHDHHYERIEWDGITYVVNGLGGKPERYDIGPPVPGSVVRFNEAHGAMLIEATATRLALRFETVDGRAIDRHELAAP
ncbi:MAG: metallophosphoesterase [Myxococcota bacterium]